MAQQMFSFTYNSSSQDITVSLTNQIETLSNPTRERDNSVKINRRLYDEIASTSQEVSAKKHKPVKNLSQYGYLHLEAIIRYDQVDEFVKLCQPSSNCGRLLTDTLVLEEIIYENAEKIWKQIKDLSGGVYRYTIDNLKITLISAMKRMKFTSGFGVALAVYLFILEKNPNLFTTDDYEIIFSSCVKSLRSVGAETACRRILDNLRETHKLKARMYQNIWGEFGNGLSGYTARYMVMHSPVRLFNGIVDELQYMCRRCVQGIDTIHRGRFIDLMQRLTPPQYVEYAFQAACKMGDLELMRMTTHGRASNILYDIMIEYRCEAMIPHLRVQNNIADELSIPNRLFIHYQHKSEYDVDSMAKQIVLSVDFQKANTIKDSIMRYGSISLMNKLLTHGFNMSSMNNELLGMITHHRLLQVLLLNNFRFTRNRTLSKLRNLLINTKESTEMIVKNKITKEKRLMIHIPMHKDVDWAYKLYFALHSPKTLSGSKSRAGLPNEICSIISAFVGVSDVQKTWKVKRW